MIIDERAEFCDAVTGVAAASTLTLRGDVYDLQVTGLDIGGGQVVYLVITIDTAFVSANNNPVRFLLVSDAQAAIAVDGTATEHIRTEEYLPADLVAGAKISHPLPGHIKPYERFIGILQDTGAGASGVTAGTFSAYLTLSQPSWKAYPDATN